MITATDLTPYRIVVVAFYMKDCPACHEYIPRLQQIAARHPNIPTLILEANQYGPYADQMRVSSVPVTFVLRKPNGAMKAEGAISNNQIEYLYGVAERA